MLLPQLGAVLPFKLQIESLLVGHFSVNFSPFDLLLPFFKIVCHYRLLDLLISRKVYILQLSFSSYSFHFGLEEVAFLLKVRIKKTYKDSLFGWLKVLEVVLRSSSFLPHGPHLGLYEVVHLRFQVLRDLCIDIGQS